MAFDKGYWVATIITRCSEPLWLKVVANEWKEKYIVTADEACKCVCSMNTSFSDENKIYGFKPK